MKPFLTRLGAVAVAAAAIGLTATPAWADTTINIDPADTGQTAAAFPVHRCDPGLGGGPFPGQDVWVFALPRDAGEFRSVTVEFATEGGPVTETITTAPAGDRAIVGDHAWIRTSAGQNAAGELVNPFSIISASAVVTGHDGAFDLAQTCPATGGSLPVTGASVTQLAGIGGALTFAGLALVALRRRRATA
ncbi:LPXTG cell wall anchor domain-containing protein [Asanoa sp. WMMD1127]|uniref:LPXTG cell wall anchor domain-containing protein n=1 Tax=Asanoa sp. WMMD1127 TaxID=3016107 RepID=UPI0024173E50|nr:LPXTG cell wall anchor domain-containing protein [Asanoa sp. WMMD1127]MDG4824875.1 LPXTG cell wall anchor domain-containing protein [Asanoa sp. WMMD1127]